MRYRTSSTKPGRRLRHDHGPAPSASAASRDDEQTVGRRRACPDPQPQPVSTRPTAHELKEPLAQAAASERDAARLLTPNLESSAAAVRTIAFLCARPPVARSLGRQCGRPDQAVRRPSRAIAFAQSIRRRWLLRAIASAERPWRSGRCLWRHSARPGPAPIAPRWTPRCAETRAHEEANRIDRCICGRGPAVPPRRLASSQPQAHRLPLAVSEDRKHIVYLVSP